MIPSSSSPRNPRRAGSSASLVQTLLGRWYRCCCIVVVVVVVFLFSSTSVVRGEDVSRPAGKQEADVNVQELQQQQLAMCQAQAMEWENREQNLLANIQELEDKHRTMSHAMQRDLETLQVQHAQVLATTVESMRQEFQEEKNRSDLELQNQIDRLQEENQKWQRQQQQKMKQELEMQKDSYYETIIRPIRKQLGSCQRRLHHTKMDLYSVRFELFQLHEEHRNQQQSSLWWHWKIAWTNVQSYGSMILSKTRQEWYLFLQHSGLEQRYQQQFQPYLQDLSSNKIPIGKQTMMKTLKKLQNQTQYTWATMKQEIQPHMDSFLAMIHHQRSMISSWYAHTLQPQLVQPIWNEILVPTYQDIMATPKVQQIQTVLRTQYQESIQPTLRHGHTVYTQTKISIRNGIQNTADLLRDYCYLQGYYYNDASSSSSSHWIKTTLQWVHDHATGIVHGMEMGGVLILLYWIENAFLRGRRRARILQNNSKR